MQVDRYKDRTMQGVSLT